MADICERRFDRIDVSIEMFRIGKIAVKGKADHVLVQSPVIRLIDATARSETSVCLAL